MPSGRVLSRLLIGLLGIYLLVAIPHAVANDRKQVVVKGSTSMEHLVKSLSKDYQKKHSDVFVLVDAHGTELGIKALAAKKADVAMASRRLHSNEKRELRRKGIKLVDIPVAVEGIAIVINKRNPLNEIHFHQLGSLFNGDYSNWKQVGGSDKPIRLFIRPPSKSGTATIIQENLLLSGPFSERAKVRDYYEQTMKEVSKNRWALTFAPFNKAASENVKILKIRMTKDMEPLAPTEMNFSRRSYPLSRTFHLLYDGSAPTHVKEFVDYCWNRGLGAR